MAHDVFISYAHLDKPTADAACAFLEARAMRCWIAPRDVLVGIPYPQQIIEAIRGSKIFVLVYSGHTNASPHVMREVERAASHGIPTIPIRLEDVPPSENLEYFISVRHWLDALTPPLEKHLAKLADTVEILLAREPSHVLPPPKLEPKKENLWTNLKKLNLWANLKKHCLWINLKRQDLWADLKRRWKLLVPRLKVNRKALLIPAAVVLACVLFLLLKPSPVPEIVAIKYPATIPADGSSVLGTIEFRVQKGNIEKIELVPVEAKDFTPLLLTSAVKGLKTGFITFSTHSKVCQKVTLSATLIDTAGRRSKPMLFSFEVIAVAPPSTSTSPSRPPRQPYRPWRPWRPW
jgi:hypothetical protein